MIPPLSANVKKYIAEFDVCTVVRYCGGGLGTTRDPQGAEPAYWVEASHAGAILKRARNNGGDIVAAARAKCTRRAAHRYQLVGGCRDSAGFVLRGQGSIAGGSLSCSSQSEAAVFASIEDLPDHPHGWAPVPVQAAFRSGLHRLQGGMVARTRHETVQIGQVLNHRILW
jgi:hypothetical protein